jgi:hypothetical protein
MASAGGFNFNIQDLNSNSQVEYLIKNSSNVEGIMVNSEFDNSNVSSQMSAKKAKYQHKHYSKNHLLLSTRSSKGEGTDRFR